MTPNHPEETLEPTPQQWAAYVDGELDAAERRLIETWLVRHPEQAAEIEGQRRLRKLMAQALPAEPTEAQWTQALAGIEVGLAAAGKRRAFRRVSAAVLAWLAVGLSAAALLAALWLNQPRIPVSDDEQPIAKLPEDEPAWEVATAADVEINMMDHADVAVLVVGEPPVREAELVLATAADVTVDSVEPASDGTWPDMRRLDDPGTPMIAPPRSVPLPKVP